MVTLPEPHVSFLPVLSMVQMQSSCLTSQPRCEITKPKFWLKKKDCQELTYRTDLSFKVDGPGAGPLVDLCHDFEGHRQQGRGFVCWRGLPLSLWNIPRGEGTWRVSTMGCSYAFASSCWFLGVSMGTHAEPSERRQEEREGDGLRGTSRVALTHRGCKRSEA